MIRSISARIDCDREILEALWRTHVVYHECLRRLVTLLFAMRRGASGETPEARALYRRIGAFIAGSSSRNAPYLLNAVSIAGWKPGTALKLTATIDDETGGTRDVTGADWADEAAALSHDGQVLFDKREILGALPTALQQAVVREAASVVAAHVGLVRRWHREHAAWLEAKSVWEADPEHQRYLALRPRFDECERSLGGRLTGRRTRWTRYVEWLGANPDLAAWRGGPAVVREPEPSSLERVRQAPRAVRARAEAAAFWEANPELARLDRLHGDYEKRFVRRRKTKKNVDGFDHRPTFTMPDPVLHPRWMLFNSPSTHPAGYRNLVLPAARHRPGSVDLTLATPEPRRGPAKWTPVRFKADARLSDLRAVRGERVVVRGARRGEAAPDLSYLWLDRGLGIERPARLRGATLTFDLEGGRPVAAHLRFTLDVEDAATSERAEAIGWVREQVSDANPRERLTKVLPEGLVTAAVHFGLRHLAYATLAVGDGTTPGFLRARSLRVGHEERRGRHAGRWSEGPSVTLTERHVRDLTRREQLTGRTPRGEHANRELREHLGNMREDRVKKLVRAVVDFALDRARSEGGACAAYPRADLLIVEDLSGLAPDEGRDPGRNRALAELNRGRLVERLRELARDVGLRLFTVPAYGIAQVCCRCGALGRRYSLAKSQTLGRLELEFGAAGLRFACPSCGYTADAAHNASWNLQRRFYAEEALSAYREFAAHGPEERRETIRDIERRLADELRRRHGIEPIAVRPR